MHLKLYFECFLREKYHVVYRFSSSRGIFKTSKVSWLLSVSFRERQITLILKILKFLSFAAMSLMRSLRSVVDDVVSGLRILEQQNQRLFPRPELALAGADGSPLHNVQNDSSVDPLGKKLKKCSPSSSLNVTWNVLASKPTNGWCTALNLWNAVSSSTLEVTVVYVFQGLASTVWRGPPFRRSGALSRGSTNGGSDGWCGAKTLTS